MKSIRVPIGWSEVPGERIEIRVRTCATFCARTRICKRDEVDVLTIRNPFARSCYSALPCVTKVRALSYRPCSKPAIDD